MSRIISNNGIGALYGTFSIRKTSGRYDLTTSKVGVGVTLTGDNEIGFHTGASVLLGRLEHVQDGIATVQVGGVVRLPFIPIQPIQVGNAVIVDSSGSIESIKPKALGRGVVIAVDKKHGHCDILL